MRAKKKFLILSGGKSLNFDFLGNSNKNQNKKYRNITFAFEFIYFFKRFLVALISYQNSGYLFKFLLSNYL